MCICESACMRVSTHKHTRHLLGVGYNIGDVGLFAVRTRNLVCVWASGPLRLLWSLQLIAEDCIRGYIRETRSQRHAWVGNKRMWVRATGRSGPTERCLERREVAQVGRGRVTKNYEVRMSNANQWRSFIRTPSILMYRLQSLCRCKQSSKWDVRHNFLNFLWEHGWRN